jgi:hypothetical protein
MRQSDEPFFRYQLEHCTARQHGGTNDESNLALSCPHCNRHKGPNLAGLDPLDGTMVALFHPRLQRWEEHFAFHGPVIVGLTPVGRATVRVLAMNAPLRIELRALLAQADINREGS